jgi:hypothetical protein
VYGVPLIPVINSSNKASTLVEELNVASVTTPRVSLTLAQMAGPVPT